MIAYECNCGAKFRTMKELHDHQDEKHPPGRGARLAVTKFGDALNKLADS